MARLLAFLKRDLLELLSYRFRLFLNLGAMLVGVFFLFFIGKTFSNSFSEYLARYGNDYFAFALLGMSVSVFVSTGLHSLADEVRNAQVEGTLEALLVTPTRVGLILFGNSLWSFLASFFESVAYLALAVVIIGLRVSVIQVLLVLLVLALTFLCFLALGMMSAAFIMAFKQGNPINLLFGTSSYFLGGLIFPVEVLPLPLQNVAWFLPITHASRAVREIFLVSADKADWQSAVVFLGLFALVAGPAGFSLLRLALSRAKREGSLVQF
jgi:ABC-2 type transport system permease protein